MLLEVTVNLSSEELERFYQEFEPVVEAEKAKKGELRAEQARARQMVEESFDQAFAALDEQTDSTKLAILMKILSERT